MITEPTGTVPITAEAIALIEAAAVPGDLFGQDAVRRYRRLARLTHPDAMPGDVRAASAFAKLAALWQQHQDARGPLVARGDLANLYQVSGGLLKLARDPADNDLMDREAAALTRIPRQATEFRAYFPRLIQARRVQDPRTGSERRANLIGALDSFVSPRGTCGPRLAAASIRGTPRGCGGAY
jgi:hypothetical protein